MKGYPKDEEKLRACPMIGCVMAFACTATYLTTAPLHKNIDNSFKEEEQRKRLVYYNASMLKWIPDKHALVTYSNMLSLLTLQ